MVADNFLTFSGCVRSVRFAIQGTRTMLRTQHNAWIHRAAATAAVALTAAALRPSAFEWCSMVLAVMAVCYRCLRMVAAGRRSVW